VPDPSPSEEDPAPQLEDAVERVVEDKVEEQVEEHVEERIADVERAAGTARAARAGALDARAGAEQARDGAVRAGVAAASAATAVAPDDPLLDTAVRRIEAQATPEQPFGRPGRPMSGRSPFRLAFSASLGVALAYALVQSVLAVRSVLILLLIAAFLAIGLNPAVAAMERRGIRRGLAVGIVLLGVLLFFAGFALAVVPPIVDQVDQFLENAPGYITDLQSNSRIADLDARYQVLDRARDLVDRPEEIGGRVFGGVLGVGKVVFSAFFSTITVLIVTLYFLANLPAMQARAYRLVPRSRRARVGLLTDEILARVGSYVAGALGIGTLAGVSTFVLLSVLGVRYPLALSMVVALTALIPLVGATIGAVLVTTVALFSSVTAALVCVVFYLVYQQVENYVIYPRVMKRSVDVSPAATVVAVLIGGSLLGVLGALLAIPLAAAVQLVLAEVVEPRQDAT
jgi:predicted PurR-regulated permease PerM